MPTELKIPAERYTRMEWMAQAPMAMRPEALRALAAQVVSLEVFDEPPELEAQILDKAPAVEEAKIPRLPKVKGAIAIIPVNGTIAQHRGSDYWGGVFSEELVAEIGRMVEMPNIGAIVLSFDSPGGIVYGISEAAGAIREMTQAKPIYGYVKAEAASAAYWLASGTTKLFAQPSSKIGSIGVWKMHIDASKAFEEIGWDITLISAGKFKTEGHPFGPLPDEARDEFQASVDRYYDDFLSGVAAGRNLSKGTVKSDFGEGRMLDAPRAKSLGMIDGIATLDELLAGIMAPPDTKRRSMATRIALESAWDSSMDG